ncbi:MAG: hypothetical protein ACMUIE_00210 [Thermoplasmatota archaeon]
MVDVYERERIWTPWMAIAFVIVIILSFIGGFILGVIVFPWEDGSEPFHRPLNIKVNLYEDTEIAGADKIEIEVISGTIEWGDYRIIVGTTTLTNTTVTTAGETLVISTGLTLTQGDEYNVKIIDIVMNKVVWEKDIIAKSYVSSY